MNLKFNVKTPALGSLEVTGNLQGVKKSHAQKKIHVFCKKVGSAALHSSKISLTFTVTSPKLDSADLNAFFFSNS